MSVVPWPCLSKLNHWEPLNPCVCCSFCTICHKFYYSFNENCIIGWDGFYAIEADATKAQECKKTIKSRELDNALLIYKREGEGSVELLVLVAAHQMQMSRSQSKGSLYIVLEKRVGSPKRLTSLGFGAPSKACQHNQKLVIGSWGEDH